MDRDPLIKKRSGHGGDVYSDESEQWLDLSANINPRAFPERLHQELPKILEEARAYPDIEYRKLKQDLAAYAGKLGQMSCDPDWIIPGNGAVEILDRAVAAQERVLIVQPCFSEYELSCIRYGIPYEVLQREASQEKVLDKVFFERLLRRLADKGEERSIDLIVLCNPNNPDGKRYDREAFREFLIAIKDGGVRVMVDETFGEYLEHEEMLLPLITDFEELLVVKALTKFFGLPGVRLGYGITRSTKWHREIERRLTTWNVGSFAQGIARILLSEGHFIRVSREENRKTREYLFQSLQASGLFTRVYPSSASFIMVYKEDMTKLIHELKNQGILIRDLANMPGLGEGYARIAVRDKDHADALLEALAVIRDTR